MLVRILRMSCYLAVIYVNLTGKSHAVDLLNKPSLLLLLLLLLLGDRN